MPPRYAYWTIIAGGLPTAFRTAEREELLPTFRRIKQKHPDAEMKYFARGRLWQSPDEARGAAAARRAAAAQRLSTRGGPSRGRDWRPGGEHRDPRQQFKDAKKVRNRQRRQDRFDRRHKPGATRPTGEASARPAPRAPRAEWRDHGPRTGKPAAQRKLEERRKPGTQGDRARRDRGPRADKPGAHHKPEKRRKPEARGDRPWRDRPPQDNRRGEPYRREPKAGDTRKPAPPGPKGPYGSPRGGRARKPAPRPRPSRPGGRPPGSPNRDRNQRVPTKDRRRR